MQSDPPPWWPFGGAAPQVDPNGISHAVPAANFAAAARRGVRQHLVLIVVFSAAINLLYLAPSIYMMQVYDRVLPTAGGVTLLLLTIVLVVTMVVMAQLDALRGRLLARASLRLERLGARAIMQEAMASRRKPTPPQVVAGMRELDTLKQGLSSPATIGMLDLPWSPLFILICFILHPWLGILALGGALLIFVLALGNERSTRSALTSLAGKSAAFYGAHEADLRASESVRALGAEPALIDRRLKLRDDLNQAQTDTAFFGADYSAFTKATRQLLQSAALGLGAFLAIQREISPGAIIAASILTARAYAPVEQIVAGWRQAGLALAAYQALRKVFDAAEPQVPRTPLPAPQGRLQVEGVSAGPPGSQNVSLSGITFQAAPGEIIGIIGPSGAGKTTLARVLANAASPRSGAIRIDGARYNDWDSVQLARHIGYLPQRVDLFDGTVSENVSCFAGEQGLSMDEIGPQVVEAAQLAGAHEMILSLPMGYDTQLGPGGSGISPGQAQRIALARALYNNPKVIVLDEPNAHLDSDGENALVVALQACRQRGALAFVIAHRAGVLGIVDKVMVLHRGQVVEFGPRDNVLASLASKAKGGSPQPQGQRP